MKNSGIEWIGEIPENWETSLVKHSVRWKSVKGQPESTVLSLYRDYGIVPKNSRDDNHNVTSLDTSTYKVVSIGDFVINKMKAWQGSMAVSDYEGIISPAYHVCEIINPNLNKKYFHHLMRNHSYVPEYTRLSTGMRVGQWDLGFDDFRNIPFIIPPVDEQKRIVSFIDKKCAEIDAIIEKTKATIEEYKKLKQSVITEAVAKGIRGNRPMRDSGIEWIGDIPAEWNIQKGKWVLKRLERPVQSTDEVITCFRDGEVTLRSNRREDGFTFSLQEAGYQGIEPGDLVVHGMDGFAGAIGISDSRGKGTPVLNVMDCTESKRYIMYYLRNMAYNGIFLALATGIRVRSCDTNWNKLKELPYLIPSIEEQKEISDFIDIRLSELDNIITKKTSLLTELETYKKSLIYEYVTGKKEVGEVSNNTTVAIVYPYYPITLNVKSSRFAQAVLMSRILDQCKKGRGRVKLEKMLYTTEYYLGFNFDTEYVRKSAGPLDSSLYDCEAIISKRNKWYNISTSKYGVSYTDAKDKEKYKTYYEKYFAEYDAEIDRIINIFIDYSTDQAEIIATLFAAWNDAIIDNKPFTDEDVVNDVLNNWHESKTRFSKDMWLRAMEEMRKNNLIPKGYGKKTVIKN